MQDLRQSNVDWLGKIPQEWDMRKLKHLVSISKRIAGKEGLDVLSVTQRGIRIKDIESNEGQLAANYSGYQLVYPGDFIMNQMDLVTGWVDRATQRGVTSPDYRVFSIVSNRVSADFLRYVMQCCYMNRVFFGRGHGVSDKGRWRLATRAFLNFEVPIPPTEEQEAIVAHLDQKIYEWDNLEQVIRAQIDALEAYKRSLILETVTKGLHPNPELVASKIDWIGDIPAHWSLRRLGTLFRVRNERVSASSFEPLSVTKNGILPQLEHVAKTDYIDNRKLVRAGDFVINSRSDRRGSCGISPQDGSVSLINTVLASRDLSEVSPYFGWLLHSEAFSDEFYRWGHGIVADLWTTNWDDMRRIVVPLPPAEEQDEINDFLKSRTENLDSTIRAKHRQLELLDSYKQSLIYESVTGKKEVPVR